MEERQKEKKKRKKSERTNQKTKKEKKISFFPSNYFLIHLVQNLLYFESLHKIGRSHTK